MRTIFDKFCRLRVHQSGNVAILFGLTIPVLLGIAALGIDGAKINHQKDWMQNTADETSLAVAKEMRLYRDHPDQLNAVGTARIEALISQSTYTGREHSADVRLNDDGKSVTVNLRMVANP